MLLLTLLLSSSCCCVIAVVVEVGVGKGAAVDLLTLLLRLIGWSLDQLTFSKKGFFFFLFGGASPLFSSPVTPSRSQCLEKVRDFYDKLVKLVLGAFLRD